MTSKQPQKVFFGFHTVALRLRIGRSPHSWLHVEEERRHRSRPVIVVGDLNVPPTEADVTITQPWTCRGAHPRGPVDFADARRGLETLMATCNLRDAAGCSHVKTWFPSPSWKSQQKDIGMRLDLVLIPEGIEVLCFQTLSSEGVQITSLSWRCCGIKFRQWQFSVPLDD